MKYKNVENITSKCCDLHQKIKKQILEQKDLVVAADLAQFLGGFAHLNFYGVYQDLDIERHLFKLASSFSTEKKGEKRHSDAKVKVLHVLTQANCSGGHTRVVESWCENTNHTYINSVVVTSQGQEAFPEKLSNVSERVKVITSNGLLERAKELSLCFSMSDIIVLHIHPHDVLPIIAAALVNMTDKKVRLYNHADHVFSYGYSICGMVYEISGYGYELSKARKKDSKPRAYIGIPLSHSSASPILPEERVNGFILSVGSSYKYYPDGEFDFIEFAVSITKKTGRKFTIIGPDKKNESNWMAAHIESEGLVDAIGGVDYSEYLSILDNASCYVDSFPFTGGTAFTEILLKGVPVFGVQLPCSGYSCLDVIRKQSVLALESQIEAYYRGEDPQYILKLKDLQLVVVETQGINSFLKRLNLSFFGVDSYQSEPPYKYNNQNLSHFEGKWTRVMQVAIENRHIPPLSISTFRLIASMRVCLRLPIRLVIKILWDSFRCKGR